MPRAGLYRAIGWEQLEGRLLLTAQLVVNTTADDIDGGTVANPAGPDGTLSLREAIAVANLDGGANISFDPTVFSTAKTIALFSALPALGNGIAMSGPGANTLTVSGRNSFQVFHVSSGSTVSISGLSIENGSTNTPALHGSATFVAGGGILNDGMLTLTDDVVSNNIISDGSNMAEGAGIFNDGTLTIDGCTISDNSAIDFALGAIGGGIGNDGALTITGSTISGNTAANDNSTHSFGGGIASSGALTIVDSTISRNTASSSGTSSEADGGGIDGLSGAVVNLTNCTIAGNSVGNGNPSAPALAKGFGGGISGLSDTITLTNCTVAGNSAVTAGGGVDAAGQGSVTLNLTNTIVATNMVGIGGTNVDINGTVASADHDLIGDGSSSLVTNGTNGNLVGTTANPIDPKLGLLSNNGGPTETMPLEPTSPAIDTGDSTAVANPPFPGPPFTDQRGTGFPRIVNGTVDIGAFEFSPIPNLVVTTAADDLDGGMLANPDGADGTLSLREAITLANLEGGGIITFAIPGTGAQSPQTITLTSPLPALTAAITIAAPGAAELIISGNDQFQVFDVTAGSVVSISGLTIAHGFNNTPALNGGVLPFVAGGGVFNGGILTLARDVLTSNAATNANNNGFAAGGAVYSTGTLTINACSLTNNTVTATGSGTSSTAGGAIDSASLVGGSTATLTITNSTLSGNSVNDTASDAIGAKGGAVEIESNATITDTTISGNTATAGANAGSDGGGIDDSGTGTANIISSTITGNTVTAAANGLGEGGGLYDFANGSLALTNCTIANNTVNSAGRGVGGGIVAFEDVDTPLTLTNCTVTGNADNFGSVGAAPTSGGGGIWDGAVIGLINTIVAGNTESAGGNGVDVSNDGGNPVSPDDHNLIGIGDRSGLTNGKNGDQIGSVASPLDAKLGMLADNGGPTQTVALLAGSPAMDAGDNAAVKNPPFTGTPFTDQRGTGFPRIVNDTVDIGAFEALPNLVVDTAADDSDGGTIASPDGPDGTLSLREAITVANLEGGAIITFNIPGDSGQTPQTITLTSALPAINGVVTITGPGANELTVSGNDLFQVFDVPSGSGASISGLTIAHGFTTGNGGGIRNEGTLALNNVVLTNCSTNGGFGGGILNEGDFSIADSTLTNNSVVAMGSDNDGGAIDNEGTMTMTNCVVSNNMAGIADGAAARGGGISNEDTATIIGSTFTNNTATGDSDLGEGGGIANEGGTLTVVGGTFSGNQAGAVSGSGSDGWGGGVAVDAGGASLTNCTIAGNSTAGDVAHGGGDGGGGLYVFEGALTLTNATVAGNSSTSGGGIAVFSSTLKLTNTIAAGNTVHSGGTGPDLFGPVSLANHNLIGIGDGSSGITNGTNGNQVGNTASPIDPKLGSLANNGGLTETMALAAGSPAIDTGDDAAVTNPPFPGPPFTDQRGTGFPRIVDGTVDIGAFEATAAAPAGGLQFSTATFNANETDPSATITLTRAAGSTGAVSVTVGVSGGTAINGTDYNFTSQVVDWADGDTTNKIVNIPLIDDNVTGESSETVDLTLSGTTGGATIGTPATATLSIAEDNDVVVQPGTVQFSAAAYNTNETDPSATITVTRAGGSTGAVSVTVGASGGTAINGTDYNFTSQIVNWADGDTANKTVNIPLIDDNATGESTQTVNFALSGATGGATIGTQGTATLSIAEDNDVVVQPGTVQFSAATYNVNETDPSATITVTRTGGSSGAVSVTVSTSNGTATAGTDYTATTKTVSWADGDTASKTITIPLLDDNATGESTQTVNLALSGATGGATIGTQGTATLSIAEDNDVMVQPGTIQFSAATYNANETDPSATITVTRTAGSSGAVSVTVSTSNGTATAGTDYTATTKTVSWADGDTASKTISIPLLDDNGTDESTQTVNLTLSNPAGGATVGAQKTATLDIAEDNDVPVALGGALFLEGQAGDDRDATFVRNLYRNLLGREPEAAGQAFWLNVIEHSSGSQATNDPTHHDEVVQGFLNSPEYSSHLIVGLYQTFLHRLPDSSGLQYWVSKLGQPGTPGGATGSSDEKFVLAAIVGSQEYYVLHGSEDQPWVDAIYEDLLGRAADGDGQSFWQEEAVLRPGDRDGVVRNLLNTPEAEHKLLDAFYPAADPSIPPPGSPADGPFALANFTGGGWEDLYFQGNFAAPTANDSFFDELQADTPWDIVMEQTLEAVQYYNAAQKGL